MFVIYGLQNVPGLHALRSILTLARPGTLEWTSTGTMMKRAHRRS